MHSNSAVGPYNIRIQTVREINQMMDTYFRSEPQSFLGNAVFEQDEAPSFTALHCRSISDAMFPSSWIGTYGLTGVPVMSPDLVLVSLSSEE